jgi:hypothetical protein
MDFLFELWVYDERRKICMRQKTYTLYMLDKILTLTFFSEHGFLFGIFLGTKKITCVT